MDNSIKLFKIDIPLIELSYFLDEEEFKSEKEARKVIPLKH